MRCVYKTFLKNIGSVAFKISWKGDRYERNFSGRRAKNSSTKYCTATKLEEEVRNLIVGRNLDGTLQLAGIRSNNLVRSSMQTIKGQKITGWTEWLSLGRYFLFLDQPTDEENILTIAN
ncbi:MAG: hypothetical protein ACI9S8_003029, partial [Chlamydiales bacterium]